MMDLVVSCNEEIVVHSPVAATAEIRRWTITNDDIYLLKFKEKPEPWLEDIILGVIDDTGLVEDVGSLEHRFDNFVEGYTNHFYDWQDGDDIINSGLFIIFLKSSFKIASSVFIEGLYELSKKT